MWAGKSPVCLSGRETSLAGCGGLVSKKHDRGWDLGSAVGLSSLGTRRPLTILRD